TSSRARVADPLSSAKRSCSASAATAIQHSVDSSAGSKKSTPAVSCTSNRPTNYSPFWRNVWKRRADLIVRRPEVGMSRDLLSLVRAGSHAELLLECPAERRSRFVADALGDFGETQRVSREQSRRKLHPPSCEIPQRRQSDECGESRGEWGPRHADFGSERRNRPRACWRCVNQSQGRPDGAVAERAQPAGGTLGLRSQPDPNRLDE